MDAELLPCPFDDGKRPEHDAARIVNFGRYYRGECRFCGAVGPSRMSEAEAKDAWNRRPVPSDGLRETLERLTAQKDGAYSERNKLVAALSKLFPASLERHEGADWEDDWRWVVFIDLPTGQASWHLHDSELPNFAHLPRMAGRKWDGHSNDEKYGRLAALTLRPAPEAAKSPKCLCDLTWNCGNPECYEGPRKTVPAPARPPEEAVKAALWKVAHWARRYTTFPYNDIPCDKKDNQWNRISGECERRLILALDHLAALPPVDGEGA